ncbi:hypothetical protein AB0K60_13350 [Thermopolyspora sp. NPDC052614]|uniref:hypothetical protein n=1 Tax=Thermopolyspora sp. NPDC052614 TaxID=3155682 RepID=UPI00342E000B
MIVKYSISESSYTVELPDSDDLAVLCAQAEDRIRENHPELARREFLTERIADGLLNGLAADATEIDLGDLAAASARPGI